MNTAIVTGALIIGLRETFEIALLISLILAVAKKRNVATLQYILLPTLLALIAGFSLGSLAYSVISSSLDTWMAEALSYLLATIIVLWVVVWSSTSTRNIEASIRKSGSLWILGGLTFLFVVREALEIALIALPLASVEFLSAIIGLTVGGGLSTIIAYTIYRYGVRLPIGVFFRILSGTLVLLGAWMMWEAISEVVEGVSLAGELEEIVPLTAAILYAIAAILLMTRSSHPAARENPS